MVVRGSMLRRRRRGCTVRDSCCWGTHRVRRVRDCDEAHRVLDCCVVGSALAALRRIAVVGGTHRVPRVRDGNDAYPTLMCS